MPTAASPGDLRKMTHLREELRAQSTVDGARDRHLDMVIIREPTEEQVDASPIDACHLKLSGKDAELVCDVRKGHIGRGNGPRELVATVRWIIDGVLHAADV